jgi:uroporphyrinogen decarboxylase
MVHSCGAVSEIIPDLIELGVDGLHPLQALAKGMDADALCAYRNRIAFVGGIDAQRLLPFGTPEEVEREVARVAGKLGNNWVASPSHEGYQADVSPEKIDALVRAVKRMRFTGADGGC